MVDFGSESVNIQLTLYLLVWCLHCHREGNSEDTTQGKCLKHTLQMLYQKHQCKRWILTRSAGCQERMASSHLCMCVGHNYFLLPATLQRDNCEIPADLQILFHTCLKFIILPLYASCFMNFYTG
jgi:hypothetical protein